MSTEADFLEVMESWARTYLFRSMTDFFNYLKISDLSLLQASALTFIYYNSPSTISDICRQMMVSLAAASQMVDRLAKQDLVRRETSAEDRRVRLIILTPAGEAFVRGSLQARKSWIDQLPSRMPNEQRIRVTAALKELISLSQGDPLAAGQ